MTDPTNTSRSIIREVTGWPGVEAGAGTRGELVFKVAGREIGYLHRESTAHFGFPEHIRAELLKLGHVERHPNNEPGLAMRRIDDESDVRDVIKLLRINYDRIVHRHGIPPGVV